MKSIEQLGQEITEIKQRNKRVEADKAWETSKTRKIIIAIATYIIIALFLIAANIQDPWVTSIVPALAFSISTWTLPYVKKTWIKFLYKK